MRKKNQFVLFMLILGFVFAGDSAVWARSKKKHHAAAVAKKKKKSNGLCADNVATSTMYFVPEVKDYCKSSTSCSAFRKEVNMQGSGKLPGNKILTAYGRTITLGDCPTAFGASGNCLTPFISVAADARYYSMGDIISMPSLKGKKITLPDGKIFIHPGYLIVEDTGGAIKGKNRFDFFTGSYNMFDENNAFGVNGINDVQIASKKTCSGSKKFTVIRRGASGYEQSLASIEDALGSTSGNGTMFASAAEGRGGAQ